MQKLQKIAINLNPFRSKSSGEDKADLSFWRERIFDRLFMAILVGGLFALIPSIWLSFNTGLIGIAFVDVAAYAIACLLFAYRKKISYTTRVLVFVCTAYTLGLIVLIATGVEGAGFVWLFAVPPFASLLLGLRWGLYFALLNVLAMITIGFLIAFGSSAVLRFSVLTLNGWVVFAANFIAANAIVTVPLGAILDGLFHGVEAQQRRLIELEGIQDISVNLRSAVSIDEILPILLDTTLKLMGTTRGSIWLLNKVTGDVEMVIQRGYSLNYSSEKPGSGLAGKVFASGETHSHRDYHADEFLPAETRAQVPPGVGGVTVPIRAANEVIGVLSVNTVVPQELNEIEVNVLKTLAEIAGGAIRRSRLRQQTEEQLELFQAFTEIDQVILSSFDLQVNLEIVVSNIVEQLQVDAVNIMLFDPVLMTLTSREGQGFHTSEFYAKTIALGEGYAGKVAQKRQPVYIPQLLEMQDNPRLGRVLTDENFISYYAVPLVAKGETRGVLEIFNRQPLNFTEEWQEKVFTLASRAAIAIDTIKVFENLEHSNHELLQSYDSTIAGWSRALDLRDTETEGHSQRTAEMAVGLARKLGVEGRDLVNLSRGALLHDIGKMGISDKILRKSGSLTAEDWVEMKMHPLFAKEMLAAISYLREAIDIPYAHHEKWDGTGYPRSIKGGEIPFAARIFAVVDVFDALTSDRPYRPAWQRKDALEYIKEQSGKHFDPQVVAAFMGLYAD